ncbi:glycosyltransferase family 2 protein [Deminuibacter soli]|uniref:Glycosyltransferase family 2 protein n=1 Tax=Deminuibacter soli TaxID=2291815 RepID=A0A3E1NNR2_9BACT|nr:glycosyltransferase family 2 protein [Deminuibacter soli]RFM29571.1 glycosyltransferase family 2 protein [Deminuibacter soli]
MGYKISIIIPVYNTENYIGQCLQSILDQQYDNLEILLINDGSTDGSAQICEKFAASDNRIVYRSIENQGVSNARNIGLQLATGDYLLFVDSDDALEPQCFNSITAELAANPADVITFQFRRYFSAEKMETFSDYKKGVLSRADIAAYFSSVDYLPFFWYPFRRLYRLAFLQKHHLAFSTEITWGEDTLFNFEVFSYFPESRLSNKVIYTQNVNPTSYTSQRYKKNLTENFIKHYEKRIEIQKRVSAAIDHKTWKNLSYYYINHVMNLFFNNIKASPNPVTELKRFRDSIVFRQLFKFYNYDFTNKKHALKLLLFRYKLYHFITLAHSGK